MNDSTANTNGRPTQAGPPLASLAAVSLGLLLAGLVVGVVLAGGVMPLPYGSAARIQDYVAGNHAAAVAMAVGTFGSSIPLAIYAATASARLRQLGITAPGATIALAGGLLASGALAASGLLQWTLARPAVREGGPLVRALADLTFLTGGPAHVVFLGLLLAGVAVPGLLLGLLPRPVAVTGLVIAA